MKKYLLWIASFTCLFISLAYAATAPLTFQPLTSPIVQNNGNGIATIEYQVTNQLKHAYTFALASIQNVLQNTSGGEQCKAPFNLQPGSSCVLSLNINRTQLIPFAKGPQVCIANNSTAGSFICALPTPANLLTIKTIDPKFPYGAAPVGNVCTNTDNYATPETMLGSWAMIQAVAMDVSGNVLPAFLNSSNVVYAVGTAAIGNQLGIPSCSGGCNQLNGFCFALKFNGKTPYPYMIFQSVNIGANNNSFDIYMAGGGSGAFPTVCQQFWGTGSSVNWADHIQNSSCNDYFGNYSSINSNYSVTYNGVTHPAKTTLQNACTFASAGSSGFNTQNWSNVSVVPVTCPQSIVQITGVKLPASITTVGNQNIHDISTLSDNDFSASTITGVTTTQMQDCKTPSSGYCNNVAVAVTNYEASISTTLTAPILTGESPASSYCQTNPNAKFCSWNNGQTSAGGTYCNANSSQCISCGNGAKWCVCNGNTLVGC